MQESVRLMEFAIVWPNVNAARAIAEPTTARINAYSAAEAPDGSFSILMNQVIERPSCVFPQQNTPCLAGAALRADAGAGRVHRIGDGVAQRDCGERNGRTDDRQNQRIFGSGSAGLVFDHTNEVRHFTIPSSHDLVPPEARVSRFAFVGGTSLKLWQPPAQWNRVKRTCGCRPPSAQLSKGCDSVNALST